jgi:hypothetical protein
LLEGASGIEKDKGQPKDEPRGDVMVAGRATEFPNAVLDKGENPWPGVMVRAKSKAPVSCILLLMVLFVSIVVNFGP